MTKFMLPLTTAVSILALSAGAHASNIDSITNDNNAPRTQSVQVEQPVKKAKAVAKNAKAKELGAIEATKIAGCILIEEKDNMDKVAQKMCDDLIANESKYEELCRSHKGSLKWYHKAWYRVLSCPSLVVDAITYGVSVGVKVYNALDEAEKAKA
jgi:hypothetical protein